MAATFPEIAQAVVTWVRNAVRAYWLPPISASNAPNGLSVYGGPTASGILVSEYAALNLTAIWCGVQVIAGGIASLPLILYKRVGEDRRERFYDHPLYRVLHDEPNPEMSAPTFWQTLIQHALLWGNGYAEIRRDQAGRVRRLDLITPDRVQIKRDPSTNELYYLIANTTRPASRLDVGDVFHLPGLGYDGVCGYSVIAMLRESLGLSLAADRFGATFFGNSAQPGGALKMPGALQPATRKALKAELDEFRGSGSHGALILENGMEWQQMSIPPDDAQFIQTRKFQVEEVARVLNVPLHKIHSMDRATFSNIEQQAKEFLSDTLLPWMAKITAECNRKLIAPAERKIQYTEHLVEERLRVDIKSRYDAYRTGRELGWLTSRMIASFENLDPPPDDIADIYLVPANMTQLGVMPAAPALAPAPTPEPDPAPGPDPTPAPERTEAPGIDLAAEVVSLREHLSQLAESLAGLATPVPVPPLDVQALGAEVAAMLRADAESVALPPDLDALRDQIIEAIRPASDPAPADTGETERKLHEWQQATVALIVGRVVRREIAFAKKWAAKPGAAERMDDFFERFVADGLDSLRPWLVKMQNGSGPLDVKVGPVLERWSERAKQDFIDSTDLRAMIARWEENHERLLTAELLEVLYDHAQ